MAGHCVTVLTPLPFLVAQKAQVASFIHGIADQVFEQQFSICGQPFFFEFDDLDEDELALLIRGWSPIGALTLGTHGGAKMNHFMLGFLSVKLGFMFDGWIQLESLLPRLTNNPAVLTYDGAAGRLQTPQCDIVSPNFMAYWMGDGDFRLV